MTTLNSSINNYYSNRCQTHFNEHTPYDTPINRLADPEHFKKVDKYKKEQQEKVDNITEINNEICKTKMLSNFKINDYFNSVETKNKYIDEFIKLPIYELMIEYIKLNENLIFVINSDNKFITMYGIYYSIINKNNQKKLYHDNYYDVANFFVSDHVTFSKYKQENDNNMNQWYSCINNRINSFELQSINSSKHNYISPFTCLPPNSNNNINYLLELNKWMTYKYNYYAKGYILYEENRLKQKHIEDKQIKMKKIIDELSLIDFSNKELKEQSKTIESNMMMDIDEEPIYKIIDEKPNIIENTSPLTIKRRNIPKQIKEELWIKYNGDTFKGKCYCCKKEINHGGAWHAGHVIASENGGNDTVENLRPICAACNLAMGTENLYDFKKRCYAH